MKSFLLACCLLAPIAAHASKDGYAVITFGKDHPIKADTYTVTPDEGWPFTDGTFDKIHILVPKEGSYTATVKVDGKPVCKVRVTKASKPEKVCGFDLVCASHVDLVISEVKGNPGRTGLVLTYNRTGTKCDGVENI
jgi:hypothetical protein